jgi:DNA-binding LacI/PurR family transcriptional regulator
LKNLTRKPTIREVAEAANVSPTTVSIVLNGSSAGGDRISPETQQRVLDSVAQLGYVPNQSARSLRRQKTDRICLFFNAIGIPYNDLLAQELENAAGQQGYSMILVIGGSAEQEHRVLAQLMRGLADGVIAVGINHLSNEEFSQLAATGCAVVVSDNYLTPTGVDLIQTSEGEASYLAMQYLHQKGHRNIGYIGNVSGLRYFMPRYQSFLRFSAEHQLPILDGYLQLDRGVSRENAYRCARSLIQLPKPPTAIYCGSDLAAISAISAIRSAGKRVPEDIAVVGAGNIPEGQITTPQLTTIGPVRLDFSTMIEMLFSRLKGEAPLEGRRHLIQWDLIERASA